ncbi:SUF system NifU family Fe-S cluster assembly protein [soil metagenome]
MQLTPEICEAILRDHFRKPRHKGICEGGESADIDNPACGDQLHISWRGGSEERLPLEVCFEGAGCAASQAGASLMLCHIHALSPGKARASLERFCQLMESGSTDATGYFEEYGEAAALLVFSNNPARVQCATLGARLLVHILRGKDFDKVNDLQQ